MNSKPRAKSGTHGQSKEASTRKSDGEAVSDLELLTLQLSQLESTRVEKRSTLETLFDSLQNIRNQMTAIQQELQQLDDEIHEIERKRNRIAMKVVPSRTETRTSYVKKRNRNGDTINENDVEQDEQEFDFDYEPSQKYAENLTQFVTHDGKRIRRPMLVQDEHEFNEVVETDYESIPKNSTLSMHPEEIFTEPTQADFDSDYEKKNHEDPYGDSKPLSNLKVSNTSRPSSGGYNALELITTGSKLQTQHINSTTSSKGNANSGMSAVHSLPSNSKKLRNAANNGGVPTLDQYFKTSEDLCKTNAVNAATSSSSIFPPLIQQRYAQSNIGGLTSQTPVSENIITPLNQQRNTESNSFSMSHIPPNNQIQQKRVFNRNLAHDQSLSSDDFDWSRQMMECLQNTFGIRQFRDHQKEIINCTMLGYDAFVIMRTGGGKSLTYQLPALLEGRGPNRKVTLVISPLLSLIRDQEDQMNAFAPGSAVSFTSGMAGGTAEQAHRWNLVRDPTSGVCIIFVTPERVHKSNKLRAELEKLHNQQRLGRFVIDECHCACQWGHDFRPDYTQLGILKTHFPDIPLIAVTATASDRVREDCCQILRLGTNYKLFRSSANRPNLTYIIKEKPDGKDAVIDDMAEFILSKHRNHAGIIYTLSKKEAEEVAQKLSNTYNIIARAFHSEISDSAKESVQRSWMKNKTQIVVATIAFGLGINKVNM